MRIPKHWAVEESDTAAADGSTWRIAAWGWSDRSLEEARWEAACRLSQLAERVAAGRPAERYAYSDRPIREELLEEITGSSGERIAAITRNGYGARVLNTAAAMFVDLDLPEPSGLRRLFGGASRAEQAAVDERLALVERVGSGIPGFAARVYRTAAGLRLLLTHGTFAPTAEPTDGLLQDLGADPLYRKLCGAQECFRARLTAKPWRIGLGRGPGARWPYRDAECEARAREWHERYDEAAAGHSACRLLRAIGSRVHPDVAPIVELHDRLACREGAELA